MPKLEYRHPRRMPTSLLRPDAHPAARASTPEPKARITGRLSLKSANARQPSPDGTQAN